MLPKAIRNRRCWRAGTRLIVEERPEGVRLRPVEKRRRSPLRTGATCWRTKDQPVRSEQRPLPSTGKRVRR
ncbi:MAG: AbrB/MazE/SpoVT family DNA-binding domain-containing protein [Proteobacteria bacterium]|nr:AbrB/MazE/SpoVT family DNA-binding domain-containing protein [Pseudomonadota bacterium]